MHILQNISASARFCAAFALLAGLAAAVETRFWQHYDISDYDKATLKNLSLRSDGLLSLAPVFKELHDTSVPHLWAVTADSKGNVYYAGGSPGATTASVFHAAPSGAPRKLADLEGLEIHALAVDAQDRLYAATSPDGKVFRISSTGQASVFYDPKAKYIWALAFHRSGDLFIATGDKGEIHKVSPQGQGSVFFSSDETHARSLAIDNSGNLIVGTEPSGLVIRVSQTGQGFVLYQASKREITSVAVGPDNAVYVAAVGAKSAAAAPPPPPPVAPAPAPGAAAARPVAIPLPATIAPSPSISGGSELWRILPDGEPRRLWNHGTELIYSIALNSRNQILAATGNRGRIYLIEDHRLFTNLVNSPSTQITALHATRNGAVFAVTANIGKLYQLGPQIEKEGTLESDTLDAGAFSFWGRARYTGNLNDGALSLETRSGNLDRPQKNWSPWAPVPFQSTTGRVASPASRFLQYRLKLTAAANGASPNVTMLELAYLSKNVAPTVDEIESTPANYRFPTSTSALSSSSPQSISLPPLGQRKRSASVSLDSSSSSSMNYAKGHIGARWRALDDNSDTLIFKVEIRGVGETTWKLLKDNLRDRQLSFDSTAFADGHYQVQVTASDAPSNAPAAALSASLISEPFLIDNTAPTISALSASADASKITVRFKARDNRSVIEKAEYSINGGDWQTALPVTRLADALELDYVLEIPRPAPGEITIAVRVADEFENLATDKATVR